jgi:hypothetical protein
VDVVNNTIAKNITTATAVTSTGQPAPAGLSTAANSDPLQARIQSQFTGTSWSTFRATYFSKPVQFNDIYYDNRAGSWDGYLVSGIGTLPNGYNGGVNNWDMGSIDVVPAGTQPLLLSPTNSVIQTTTGYTASATNDVTSSPGLAAPYDMKVDILPSRTYPAFKQSLISGVLLPPSLMGDYHLAAGSTAIGQGVASKSAVWGTGSSANAPYTVSAPSRDVDNQTWPTGPGSRWDAGSDHYLP